MSRTLRIVTVNLFNGAASPKALGRFLQRTRPDVVATQELAPNAAAVLEAEFAHGRLEPRLDYLGAGLSLRHPALVERFPLAHRDGLRSTLLPGEWPQLSQPLEVISVHIANPLLRPFARYRAIRGRQVDQILDHVRAASAPRLLVGDFNATPLWPVHRRLAGVLDDAAKALGRPRRTWGLRWWAPRLLRIDHAFSQELVPVSVEVARIGGADHSALILDIVAP